MKCLRSARYNMSAEIVHTEGPSNPTPSEVSTGHWEWQQDEYGELHYVWVEDETPETPEEGDVTVENWTFPCMARGYVGTGLQGGGTGEEFGNRYEAIDTIRIWFSPEQRISKNDQITNIRGPHGIIWKEEELGGLPTKFDVMGVTPLIDHLGRHVESYALCERSEIQQ